MGEEKISAMDKERAQEETEGNGTPHVLAVFTIVTLRCGNVYSRCKKRPIGGSEHNLDQREKERERKKTRKMKKQNENEKTNKCQRRQKARVLSDG